MLQTNHQMPEPRRLSEADLVTALQNRNKYFLFYEQSNFISDDQFDVFLANENADCIFRDFGADLKITLKTISRENTSLFLFTEKDDYKAAVPEGVTVVNLFRNMSSYFQIKEEKSIFPSEFYEIYFMEGRNYDPVIFEIRDYKNYFEAQMLYQVKCMIKMYQILKKHFVIN
ncbi:hypothetical protein [Succinivibrio sp.]|uniref:hypothetical protein n=1 Tax=Succinivibrio sp. TaxID=2053619 RepID=UPI0025D04474|nr:hypothetical protein [Succinivibrio sp.]MBQ9220051.1 hypothetical protein [Succinivibrio sp.]